MLSLAEACKLHTISDFDYKWGPVATGKRQLQQAPDSLVRDAIGESIPPRFMYLLGKHLLAISTGKAVGRRTQAVQLELFALDSPDLFAKFR